MVVATVVDVGVVADVVYAILAVAIVANIIGLEGEYLYSFYSPASGPVMSGCSSPSITKETTLAL